MRALGDAPADVTRAGEGDQLHALVLDEHVADVRRRADDDVQPACGQARLVLKLGQEQRGKRRLARRLQDDGTARRQCGRELVRDEIQGKVERADRADDPDRLTQRERELAGARLRRVHRHHLTRELAGLDSGERVRRHRAHRLDTRGLHRLARLIGDHPRHFFVTAAERPGDLDEDLGALVRGHRFAHRRFGRVQCLARLARAGLRDASDDLAGERRAHIEPLTRLNPFSADQQAFFGKRRDHGG